MGEQPLAPLALMLCLAACAGSHAPAGPATATVRPSASAPVNVADPSPVPMTSPNSATQVLPFSKKMVRPQIIRMVAPVWTPEAAEARVAGMAIVKCVITTAGSLLNCRVLKGLPYMNDAILAALAQWQLTPALLDGTPVCVEYVLPINIRAPEKPPAPVVPGR